MAKYHLTRKAVQDLDAIWAYTLETWSEKKADEYYSALVGWILHPSSGREKSVS